VRHYEIVVIIHPDQRDQLAAMLQRYRSIVETSGGTIHRQEDWGRRQLAYPIQKLHKANYILMNVECTKEALEELELGFRFNDAVLRNLIVKCDEAITEPSSILVAAEKREKEYAEKRERNHSRDREDKPKPAVEEKTVVEAKATEDVVEEAKTGDEKTAVVKDEKTVETEEDEKAVTAGDEKAVAAGDEKTVESGDESK
jgi:small subunit ribosomal protein S6